MRQRIERSFAASARSALRTAAEHRHVPDGDIEAATALYDRCCEARPSLYASSRLRAHVAAAAALYYASSPSLSASSVCQWLLPYVGGAGRRPPPPLSATATMSGHRKRTFWKLLEAMERGEEEAAARRQRRPRRGFGGGFGGGGFSPGRVFQAHRYCCFRPQGFNLEAVETVTEIGISLQPFFACRTETLFAALLSLVFDLRRQEQQQQQQQKKQKKKKKEGEEEERRAYYWPPEPPPPPPPPPPSPPPPLDAAKCAAIAGVSPSTATKLRRRLKKAMGRRRPEGGGEEGSRRLLEPLIKVASTSLAASVRFSLESNRGGTTGGPAAAAGASGGVREWLSRHFATEATVVAPTSWPITERSGGGGGCFSGPSMAPTRSPSFRSGLGSVDKFFATRTSCKSSTASLRGGTATSAATSSPTVHFPPPVLRERGAVWRPWLPTTTTTRPRPRMLPPPPPRMPLPPDCRNLRMMAEAASRRKPLTPPPGSLPAMLPPPPPFVPRRPTPPPPPPPPQQQQQQPRKQPRPTILRRRPPPPRERWTTTEEDPPPPPAAAAVRPCAREAPPPTELRVATEGTSVRLETSSGEVLCQAAAIEHLRELVGTRDPLPRELQDIEASCEQLARAPPEPVDPAKAMSSDNQQEKMTVTTTAAVVDDWDEPVVVVGADKEKTSKSAWSNAGLESLVSNTLTAAS